VQQAVRDCLHRTSRKPLTWGGLAGYEQLAVIGQALSEVPATAETAYLCRLAGRVNRALEAGKNSARDLGAARQQLCKLAATLGYTHQADSLEGQAEKLGAKNVGQLVRAKVEELMEQFKPDLRRQPAQARLSNAWQRLYKSWGGELFHCYDIVDLPGHNMGLEGVFGRLRRPARRLSGRKSTRELGQLGQYQILFEAESETQLLEELRSVSLEEYRRQRQALATAEAGRQAYYRLHREPDHHIRQLLVRHEVRRQVLVGGQAELPLCIPVKH
jgi:hypothetical protein